MTLNVESVRCFQCFLNKCFLYLPRLHLFNQKYCKNISIFYYIYIYIYSNAIYSCDGKAEISAAITLDLKVFLIPHSDQHSPLFHIPRRFLALALLDPSVGWGGEAEKTGAVLSSGAVVVGAGVVTAGAGDVISGTHRNLNHWIWEETLTRLRSTRQVSGSTGADMLLGWARQISVRRPLLQYH